MIAHCRILASSGATGDPSSLRIFLRYAPSCPRTAHRTKSHANTSTHLSHSQSTNVLMLSDCNSYNHSPASLRKTISGYSCELPLCKKQIPAIVFCLCLYLRNAINFTRQAKGMTTHKSIYHSSLSLATLHLRRVSRHSEYTSSTTTTIRV